MGSSDGWKRLASHGGSLGVSHAPLRIAAIEPGMPEPLRSRHSWRLSQNRAPTLLWTSVLPSAADVDAASKQYE